MQIYSKENVNAWFDYYSKVKSTRKTADCFKVSRPTIKRLFKKYGFQITGTNRKHFFKEDFFNFDAPESFYWAGFLAADGCINSNRVSICLAIKDIEHIELFKKAIGHDIRIKISDQRPFRNSTLCSIEVGSVRMIKDLERFNIYKRKSLTYVFPEWLKSHKFCNHFVRGYFDGDGCVSVGKEGRTYFFGVGFAGTENCLDAIRDIFFDNCAISKERRIRFDSGIFKIAFNGRRLFCKIRDFLYSGSNETIELKRKRDKFFSVTGEKAPQFNAMPIITTDLDGNDIRFFKSILDAEKIAGYDADRVSLCVRGKRENYKNRLFRFATEEEKLEYISWYKNNGN